MRASLVAGALALLVPLAASATPQSCSTVLAASDDSFAQNTRALLQALRVSDAIELPGDAPKRLNKKDKDATKLIFFILLKKTSETAKKAIGPLEMVSKVYDLLVPSLGFCDDVTVCSKLQTHACGVAWIKATLPNVFADQLNENPGCAQNLLRLLLTIDA